MGYLDGDYTRAPLRGPDPRRNRPPTLPPGSAMGMGVGMGGLGMGGLGMGGLGMGGLGMGGMGQQAPLRPVLHPGVMGGMGIDQRAYDDANAYQATATLPLPPAPRRLADFGAPEREVAPFAIRGVGNADVNPVRADSRIVAAVGDARADPVPPPVGRVLREMPGGMAASSPHAGRQEMEPPATPAPRAPYAVPPPPRQAGMPAPQGSLLAPQAGLLAPQGSLLAPPAGPMMPQAAPPMPPQRPAPAGDGGLSYDDTMMLLAQRGSLRDDEARQLEARRDQLLAQPGHAFMADAYRASLPGRVLSLLGFAPAGPATPPPQRPPWLPPPQGPAPD